MRYIKTAGPRLCMLLIVALVGCQEHPTDPQPNIPELQNSADPSRRPKASSLDEWFVLTARQVPGFAGLYYDRQGVRVIRLADVTKRAAAEAALAERLAEFPAEAGTRVLKADYNFLELDEWRSLARHAVMLVPGITSLDVDEMRNRLVIGITDLSAQGEVESKLADLSIPREAVVITEEHLERLTDLDERVRPVAGGLQIARSTGPTTFIGCTLGFNATWNDGLGNTFRVFSTASHCSSIEGSSDDQTIFYQALPFSSHRIGQEFRDPYGFDHDDEPFWCPIGVLCRWADFLLADYDNEGDPVVGLIARTTSRGRSQGSVTLNPSDSVFYVTATAEYPAAGQELNKVGATTGWTYGWVTDSCKDYLSGAVLYVCQYSVSAGANSGDSGSPVFSWTGPQTAALYGAVWARIGSQKFVFSSLSKIKKHIYSQGGVFTELTYQGQIPGPPLTVSINGPSVVQPNAIFCTWFAVPSGGTPPYHSYQWSGVLSGTSSSVSGPLFNSGWLYLSVKDSSSPQQTQGAQKYITVDWNAPLPCQ